jgi:hypothetical protein
MLVLSGMVFLLVSWLDRISIEVKNDPTLCRRRRDTLRESWLGTILIKIEPGRNSRILAAVIGAMLIVAGISLQFVGTLDVYAKMSQNLAVAHSPKINPVIPANTSASHESSITKENMAIKVVSGTYGRSCNSKIGNATALLSNTCDGRISCDYNIDSTTLEDLSSNCGKDFAAEWVCGNSIVVFSAAISNLNNKNEKLHLNCYS